MNSLAKPMMDVTEEQAAILIGKHILVGLAHHNAEGETISREQFHGIVDRATLAEGVVINLHGTNEQRAVPLEVSYLKVAQPGEYRLKSTNEIVEEPDYTLEIDFYPDECKV